MLCWNAALDSVDRMCRDRLAPNAAPLDEESRVVLLQSCIRAALSYTATSFYRATHPWIWSNGITFDRLNAAYERAFQRIVAAVTPKDSDGIQVRFSLTTDTVDVRPVRPDQGTTQMQQAHNVRQGRSLAARVLNVYGNVLSMVGLEPLNKRARLNVVAPPPPGPTTLPPAPPQPLITVQIERNEALAIERQQMA